MTEHEEKLCKNQKPATRGDVYETGKFYWNMTKGRIDSKLEPIEKALAELRKHNSDPQSRYAFEWYMKAEDEHYWKMTKRHLKRITALAATSTVIGVVAIVLAIISLIAHS